LEQINHRALAGYYALSVIWRCDGHLDIVTMIRKPTCITIKSVISAFLVIGDKEKSRLLLKHVISEDFANEGYK
jgi:hypothetical protein